MTKKPSLTEAAQRPAGRERPGTLDELIRAIQQPPTATVAGEPLTLAVDRLTRGRYQPRQINDVPDAELLQLADSIRALGIIEPIAVRPHSDQAGQFEILAGDRRWRAARLAGLTRVPVIVHDVDDQTAAAMALVENLLRQDLNPMETAAGMQRLRHEFKLSQEQLGRVLGLSKSAISRMLGLLSLPLEVQTLVRAGQLDAGHARVLLGLTEADQCTLAQQAVAKHWPVRELEKRRAALLASSQAGQSAVRLMPSDPDIARLETTLASWLAAPVKIRTGKTGSGAILIYFANAEACSGVLQKIGFDPEANLAE